MIADVEVRVVDPDRSPARERSTDQSLPEPRHRVDASTDRVAYRGEVQRRGRTEDEDGRDLHRRAGKIGGELHQVGRTRPLDH